MFVFGNDQMFEGYNYPIAKGVRMPSVKRLQIALPFIRLFIWYSWESGPSSLFFICNISFWLELPVKQTFVVWMFFNYIAVFGNNSAHFKWKSKQQTAKSIYFLLNIFLTYWPTFDPLNFACCNPTNGSFKRAIEWNFFSIPLNYKSFDVYPYAIPLSHAIPYRAINARHITHFKWTEHWIYCEWAACCLRCDLIRWLSGFNMLVCSGYSR